MRYVGAHLPVYRNEPAFGDVHAGRIGADLVAVRGAADCDENAVEELRLGRPTLVRIGALEGRLEAVLLRLDLGDLDLEMDTGIALRKALLQWAHQIGIGARHQLIEQFDDGDFATERVVHAGNLEADDAAADDEKSLRDVGQRERIR